MKICKMQGAGNDFIIVDNLNGEIAETGYSRLAAALCRQHVGAGADGMMFVIPSVKGADFKMRFFNADGSEGEMCGNGARCIARYGYDHGLSGEVQTVETISGTVHGKRISERLYEIRLNDPTVIELNKQLSYPGGSCLCHYIELGFPGLPHAIYRLPDNTVPDRDKLFALGQALRAVPELEKGANVTFVSLTGEDTLSAVTFERGVEDFTLACGTGAGSTVTALTLLGLVSGRDVSVSMPGGLLKICLEHIGKAEGTVSGIYLTGPAVCVFEGETADNPFSY